MPSDVTLLVVVDDEATERQVRQTLPPRYKVLTASSWTQAHEIRARADIDGVVADLNLMCDDGEGLEKLCIGTRRRRRCVRGESQSFDCCGRGSRSAPGLFRATWRVS